MSNAAGRKVNDKETLRVSEGSVAGDWTDWYCLTRTQRVEKSLMSKGVEEDGKTISEETGNGFVAG